MFLLNSRLSHFSATLRRGHPFSRSYRVNLPSSLAMIHSSTLGFSPRLPVSVYGTGGTIISLESFLGSLLRVIIRLSEDSRYCHLSTTPADLPASAISTGFNVLFRQYADLSLLRHPFTDCTGTGILTCCPSAFPFGLALGPD